MIRSPFEDWIERGDIQASDAAQALLREMRREPSLQEYLLSRGVLQPIELLRSFAWQTQRGGTFRQACEQLGYWSERLQSEADQYRKDREIDVGRVIHSISKPTAGQPSKPAESELAETWDQDFMAPVVPKPTCVYRDLLPLFLDVFNEERVAVLRAELDRLASHANMSFAEKQKSLRCLFESLHLVRGSARLVGAMLSETLLDRIERVVTKFLGELPTIRGADWDRFRAVLSEAIGALWRMRDQLETSGAEVGWWERSGPTAQPMPASAEGPRSLRVLLVDDTRTSHAFVRDCLSGSAYAVTSAYDGVEALEILKRDSAFDLILLDWEMPKMDGPALIAALQREALVIPTVMMTARSDTASIQRMLDAGVKEFVMKPFTQDILIQKLGLVLELMDAA